MKKIKAGFILFAITATLNSCLVTTAPRYHYFISANNIEKDSIKVTIFSTPKYKDYVVTNTELNAQVLIKSPIFENPNEFYLMQNQDFFEKKAKQYQIAKRDGKYYQTDDYKSATLKIISKGDEKVINYKISGD
ncbi:MAG TPA: hypothetical protein VFI29_12135 [Hanamia sp.]|nr:hypothetical protein [Hanamia sp.]